MSVTKASKIINVLFITKGKFRLNSVGMQKKTSHTELSLASRATDLPACALHVRRNPINLLILEVRSDRLLEKGFIRTNHSV